MPESKQKTGDIPDNCGADALGSCFGITGRQVQRLTAQGVFKKTTRGVYETRENIQRYVEFVRSAGSDEKTLRAELLTQQIREATRENDLADELNAPVTDFAIVHTQWSHMAVRDLDAIPATMKSTSPEMTGRAYERCREAIDRIKSDLYRIPERLGFSAAIMADAEQSGAVGDDAAPDAG